MVLTSSLAVTRKMKVDCKRIIDLLSAKGVKFENIDLALENRGQDLIKHSSHSAILLPQIFINGKYVGSLDTVQELEDDGSLDVMLGIF